MNILITGGYGFIGKHLARRLYKEGHKVHIIDNLSGTQSETLEFKHKFYKLDIKDPKCKRIFAGTHFEQVIHLVEDAKGYALEDLKTVMDLAIAYEVPRVIYLSSTDVYALKEGEKITEDERVQPKSLKEIEWVAGENYLELCHQNHPIEVQCLRVSNVYGDHGEGLNKWRGKESKKILRDYIHIGDVVDAIYKATEFSASRVLNICSYTLSNTCLVGEKGIYLEKSGYSNEKAIYELNWVPRHCVQDQIIQNVSEEQVTRQKAQEEQTGGKNIKRVLPYLENILSFGVITALSLLLQKYHIPPIIDLGLVYIAVMSIIYGLNQSIIAIVLASIFYIANSLSHGQSLIALVYDPNTLLSIGLYIFVGSMLGYIIDSKKHEILEKERVQKELQEKMNFIHVLYKETVEEKKALEYQITTSEGGIGKVYRVISELDSLSAGKVFEGAIGAIEELANVRHVAIYMNSEKSPFLRLASYSNQVGYQPPQSINLKQWEEAYQAITQNQIYINPDLGNERPVIMAPIVMEGKTIAVICLHQLSFKQLNLNTKNLIYVICNLITTSLINAYQYEAAIWDKKYVAATSILQPHYFAEVLKDRADCMKKGISTYTLLQIHIPLREGIYEQIKESIRDVDYIGMNEKNQLFLILSNTDSKGAQFVIDRLASRHISATIQEEQGYWEEVEMLGGVV